MSTDDLRLYTVRVTGETAAGVPFTERRRVAALDYAGARTAALARFPGCRITGADIEAVTP